MEGDLHGLGLTEARQALLDQAVTAEVTRARLVHQFLPEVSIPANERHVRRDAIDDALVVNDRETRQITELRVEFELTPEQLADPNLEIARALVARASNLLGRAEDGLVLAGQGNGDAWETLPGLRVLFGEASPGLVREARLSADIAVDPNGYGEALVRGLAEAMGKLEAAGYIGPYSLIVGTAQWTESHRPQVGLVLPRDRIEPMIGGAILRSSVLPVLDGETGVLVSRGGDTMDRAVGLAPVLRFLRPTDDRLRFAVRSRMAFRLKQRSAACRLVFRADQKRKV